MRLSMAIDLLNLRVASSFRAESSIPAFPASSRMSDCCFYISTPKITAARIPPTREIPILMPNTPNDLPSVKFRTL